MSTTLSPAAMRNEMIQRVRGLVSRTKSASSAEPTDPRKHEGVEIPKDPEATEKKIGVPPDSRPKNDKSIHDGVTAETKPNEALKDVPAVSATKPFTTQELGDKAARAMSNLRGLLTPKTAGTTVATPAKVASTPVNAGEITPQFAVKLASYILASEEGTQYALDLVTKAEGAAAAQELIKSAAVMQQRYISAEEAHHQEFLKAAAYHQAEIAALDQEIAKLPEKDRLALVKIASAHKPHIDHLAATHPDAILWYKQGAADAEAMGPALGPPGGDPAAAGAAGGPQPEIPGGGDQPSPEEIIKVLQMLVQIGALDEQTAMQIAQEIMGAGGGEGADPSGGAGGPPGAGGAGADPAAMAAAAAGAGGAGPGGPPPGKEEEVDKQASAIFKRTIGADMLNFFGYQ